MVSFFRKRGPLDRRTQTGSAVLWPAIYRGHKGSAYRLEVWRGIRSVPDFGHRAITLRNVASPVGGLPVGVADAVVPHHMSRRNLYVDTRDRGSVSPRQRLPWAPLKWALRLRAGVG